MDMEEHPFSSAVDAGPHVYRAPDGSSTRACARRIDRPDRRFTRRGASQQSGVTVLGGNRYVGTMANRLADATSPYLAQHADNPVDWWPWCPEAFAEARRRDVPVLLSVGYAACHWCHVMAHESFEDAEVAAALNEGFVAIKVDREERPDIDAVYMAATAAMTGHGGWPMTCLLTPSGEPFFCGTYFPKDAFLRLLAAANQAWTERQDEVLATGGRIVQALQAALATGAPRILGTDVLDQAVARLGQHFDRTSGGYGSAPKFPPSMVLEFLLRHHARTGSASALEQAR